jgi:hypothetical protein
VERLIYKEKWGYGPAGRIQMYGDVSAADNAFKRLYEYEDTGLTPEEITAMQAENQRLRDANRALENDLTNATMNLEHTEADLSALRGQIERGEMERVVRCRECESGLKNPNTKRRYCDRMMNCNHVSEDHFCACGTARASLKEG